MPDEKVKESTVQKWVMNLLADRLEGVYSFKVPQGQYISRRGIPDIVFSYNGRFYAIEVKTSSGKLSKLQEFEMIKLRRSGAKCWVVYGRDYSHMDAIIEEIMNDI